MLSPSPSEQIALRFGGYIEELREFLTSRRLTTGSLEDLEPFMGRVTASESFKEEMASMVRSILYREDEAVSRDHLTGLLLVTITGAHAEEAKAALNPEVGRVRAFVDETMRGGWATAGLDSADDEGERQDSPHDAPIPDLLHGFQQESFQHVRASLSAHGTDSAFSSPKSSKIESDTPINAALSRALTQSGADSSEESHAEGDATVSTPTTAHFETERQPSAVLEDDTTAKVPAAGSSPARRLLPWAAAICAVPLAFVAGFFLRPQKSESPIPVTQITAAHTPARSQPGEAEFSSAVGRGSDEQRDTGSKTSSSGSQELTKSLSPPRLPRASAAPQGVFFVSSGVMTANLLSAPPPEYPKLASLMHVEGPVILQAVVAKDGTVMATHALSGHHLLRSAAERAVREWRYRPYQSNGRPTEVVTVVTVAFRLHR
jgi:TonB family protein